MLLLIPSNAIVTMLTVIADDEIKLAQLDWVQVFPYLSDPIFGFLC